MAVPMFTSVGVPPQIPAEDVTPKHTEEVRLYENAREREAIDNRANVFALIQTIQALEKAYLKDAVAPGEYASQCSILLAQFTAAFKLVKEKFPTVEEFMKRYLLDCPAALERIKEGRPLTVKDDGGNIQKSIAEIVSLFITIMDRLRLEIKAMDELHPDVKELHEIMSRMSSLPPAFEGRVKVKKWLDNLNAMSASDELSEDQVRQMLFDLESAYNDFNRFLTHST